MNKKLWGLMILAFILVFQSGYGKMIFADPGDLDPGFGSGGLVSADIGGFDTAIDVAIQSNKQIVISGATFGSETNFVLARYDSTGQVDNTFGTNGIVQTNLSSVDIGREIAIQTDGKIIVGGSTEINGNKDFALIRYNGNGSLDTTFDSDGVVVTPITSDADEIWGIALQTDGKIVVTGTSNSQLTIARYLTNGSLDNSFGTNGITIVAGAIGQVIRVQTDGKLVVAGRTGNDYMVVRLQADGTLDNTFDTDGLVTTDMGGGGFVTAWDLSVQNDGKIVVVGNSFNGSDYDIAAVRYNTNGSIDTSFGTAGKAIYDFGQGDDDGAAVAIQADNKILVGGHSNTGTAEVFTLLRLDTDGTLDSTFSDDGIVTTPAGQRALGLAIQIDNQIVMTGYGSGDFVTARYEGDPLPVLDKQIFLPFIVK